MIARDLSVPHISSGDIFRENIRAKTALGEQVEKYVTHGKLVPDDLAVDTILHRLAERDCGRGFVLDGFPRTLAQAELLARRVKIDRVIQIVSSPETVVARLGGRYTCRNCGAIHNTRWEDVSKCRECSGQLYQREDDHEAAIRRRLEQYYAEFAPILAFYTARRVQIVTVASELAESPEDIYEKYKLQRERL